MNWPLRLSLVVMGLLFFSVLIARSAEPNFNTFDQRLTTVEKKVDVLEKQVGALRTAMFTMNQRTKPFKPIVGSMFSDQRNSGRINNRAIPNCQEYACPVNGGIGGCRCEPEGGCDCGSGSVGAVPQPPQLPLTITRSVPVAVTQTPRSYVTGQGHTHTCPKCGTTWDHGAWSSHNCPNCGTFQNVQDTGRTVGAMSSVVTYTSAPVTTGTVIQAAPLRTGLFRGLIRGNSNCANGQCAR
jgi:hypothetical protein